MTNITNLQTYKKAKAIENLTTEFDRIRDLYGNVNLLVAVAYVNIKEHGSFEIGQDILTEEFLRTVLLEHGASPFEIPLNDQKLLESIQMYMEKVPTNFESITFIDGDSDTDV